MGKILSRKRLLCNTTKGKVPDASVLPREIDEKGNQNLLGNHTRKGNQQKRSFKNGLVMGVTGILELLLATFLDWQLSIWTRKKPSKLQKVKLSSNTDG